MMTWRIIRTGLVVILIALVFGDLWITVLFKNRLYNLYMDRLDGWVAAGGPRDKIQSGVIPDCSKLILTQAGPVGMPMLALSRPDYDFEADVCFQVTANRVYPQPRFEDPAMVSLVCDSKTEVFRKLCSHAALKTR